MGHRLHCVSFWIDDLLVAWSSMNVTLNDLPIELKRAICRQMPQPDLLDARLASSELCAFTTEFAFHSVSLLADKEAAGDFASIARSIALRKHVRHVTLDTRLEDYDHV